ncbi:MAG: M48 family metalloprotease [Variovorax sp.]
MIFAPPAALAQFPGLGGTSEMTASEERTLGDRVGRELYHDSDYIDDPVLVEYVQQIWQRLLAAARTRGDLTPELDERFAWTMLLGRDRNINAFALPGGYMGLNLGLVAVVGSRDELATVLGHELSHITQRHIARMFAQQSRKLPLMLAAMILGAVAAAKSRNSDAGQALLVGGQAAFAHNQLAYSRDMEREADRVGFGVMTQAGFAPQGAAAMFERLQFASRLNDNGSYPYLRTHPLNGERIADMQLRVQSSGGQEQRPPQMDHAMIAARARVLTQPGVDMLRGLVAAAALGGDFDRSAPVDQAASLYAAALSASELRDVTAARKLVQRLAQRTAADPAAARLSRLLAAEIELATGSADGARRAASLVQLQAKTRPELLLAARAAVAEGNPQPAALPLRDWLAVHPRDAGAWRQLSAVYAAMHDPLRAIRAEAEAHVAELDFIAARDRFKAAQDLVRLSGAGQNAVPIDYFEASIVEARARAVDALAREQFAEKPLQ